MDFILGMCAGAFLFGVLFFVLELRKQVNKPAKQEMTPEQKQRLENIKKAYNEMMSYDVDKARGTS